MNPPPDRNSPQIALALQCAGELFHQPRVLQDARILGALHAELTHELGDDARFALFQLGFFQGLRDATRLLQRGFHGGVTDSDTQPMSPLLSMQLAPRPSDLPPGAVEVRGTWPERLEASARMSTLGVSPNAVCFASAGYTSGWLSGVFETLVLAVETNCATRGDAECAFIAREPQACRDAADAQAVSLVEALDFERLRTLVAETLDTPSDEPLDDGIFDPASPVVHVWGPVMVIPFAGADASVKAVGLIQRDAAAAGVSVIVVDLGGVILDEGFGALALERVVDAVHALGAEAIVTGVSPICEPLVADLECGQVLIEKDISQAIATAFQIADAQRHAV